MEVLHLSFNTAPHSRLFITSYSSIKRYIEYCFAVTRATFTVSQQRQPLNQTLQIKERKNKIMGQVNRWRVVSYRSQNIFLWKSVTDSLMKITLYSCASSATSIDNNIFFLLQRFPGHCLVLKLLRSDRAGAVIWVKLLNDARNAF